MSPKNLERLHLQQMANLGLTAFETGDDCHRRQSEMLVRLRAAGFDHFADQVASCTLYNCDAEPCFEGCNFASFRRRVATISSAHRLLASHVGPIHQATILLPRWELPPGHLADANIPAMRQWAARKLKGLGIEGLIAVGIVEASFNVELSGERFWCLEIQMIVAGASHEALKEAFAVPASKRYRKHQTPVMINEIGSLGKHLGYAQKHYVCERRAYTSSINGRQARNKITPRPSIWAEHDAWLLSLAVGARTIAYGCVRRGQILSPLS